MFTRIEAENFRCMKRVSQDLNRFHVLIGPNGSGKSTFLQVLVFLKNVAAGGPLFAVANLSFDYRDLFWNRQGTEFALAVEAAVPGERQTGEYKRIRYEVAVGVNAQTEQTVLLDENLWLLGEEPRNGSVQMNLPDVLEVEESLIHDGRTRGDWREVVRRARDSSITYFHSERTDWRQPFKFTPDKSALGNLPADEENWPAASWFKDFLFRAVQLIELDPRRLRMPSPPGSFHSFFPSLENLPWIAHALAEHNPDRFEDWVRHVQTALPELRAVRSIERPEDRHRYLLVEYADGLQLPSWSVSDGTLRLLALTLLGYLPDYRFVTLIEEPENGIHPRALQNVYDSISNVYDAQVLVTTHSPVMLSLVDTRDVLCFSKNPDGSIQITPGEKHPKLRDWRGDPSLDTLFASGILG